MTISAIVLAAGASTRMTGQHKLLLPLGDKKIIEHTVDHLQNSKVDEIFVVVGHQAERITQVIGEKKLRIIPNPNYMLGISSSIISGVNAASKETEAYLISLADLPLVTSAEINHMIAALTETPQATIAVPTFKGQRGNPAILKRCHREEILKITGDVGCKPIIKRHHNRVIEVEMPTDAVLRDIDTLEAYDAILEKQAITCE